MTAGSWLGFDHVDCRVRSLAAVEAFYDALMPALGLPQRKVAYVDPDGGWHEPSAEHSYNTVEYFEPPVEGRAVYFFGVIERPDHVPTLTRIAFRVERDRMQALRALIERAGGRNVEGDGSDDYPAIFFEDPSGTLLEIVARQPR